MDFKHPAEAEIYGLKLRFLLTPIEEHPLPLLRNIAKTLKTANFPLDNRKRDCAARHCRKCWVFDAARN